MCAALATSDSLGKTVAVVLSRLTRPHASDYASDNGSKTRDDSILMPLRKINNPGNHLREMGNYSRPITIRTDTLKNKSMWLKEVDVMDG